MQDFTNRTAIITGGGSGIGEALARRCAAEGMKVIVADINLLAAERVSAELTANGATARSIRCDVADPASVAALADSAWEAFGSVDLLCNNAGIVPSGRYRPVWDYPLEDWKWAFDVNFLGVIHGIRSFVPRMLAQHTDGHIVNTASVAGLVSGAGSPVYSAAKHAVVRITEALYTSLAEQHARIGVTLLCPGLVNTQIYQSERNRPADLIPALGVAEEAPELQAVADALYKNALSPETVADLVFGAIRANQFYLITSDRYDETIKSRSEAVLNRRNPVFENLLALSQDDTTASKS